MTAWTEVMRPAARNPAPDDAVFTERPSARPAGGEDVPPAGGDAVHAG